MNKKDTGKEEVVKVVVDTNRFVLIKFIATHRHSYYFRKIYPVATGLASMLQSSPDCDMQKLPVNLMTHLQYWHMTVCCPCGSLRTNLMTNEWFNSFFLRIGRMIWELFHTDYYFLIIVKIWYCLYFIGCSCVQRSWFHVLLFDVISCSWHETFQSLPCP